MKKAGRRPSLIITKDVIENIERLSGIGLTQYQISYYYGISKVTWHKLRRKNKRLERAFKKGKSQAIASVAGRLMQKIQSGNLTAIIFYLKTQAGWSEKSTLKVEDKVKSKKKNYSLDTMDAIEASKIYQSIMTGSYNDE